MPDRRSEPPPLPEGYDPTRRHPSIAPPVRPLSEPPPSLVPSPRATGSGMERLPGPPRGPGSVSGNYAASQPPGSGESEPLWAGRIRVGDEVGHGAMSTVRRGKDVKLGRELAVKVVPMPRDKMARAELARFVEEAQITAQLEHPNVVPVHDLGVDPEGRAYFTMKLVRGRSLESILEQRKEGDKRIRSEFGLRRMLDVFLQVCHALDYAHARGVIHRDLKPANIMVGDFGEVLVMDWGVAKIKGRPDDVQAVAPSAPAETPEPAKASETANGEEPAADKPVPVQPVAGMMSVRAGKKAWQTQHGTVVGTPAYMSPEQAKGGAVDERSDLYSLGVILYEMLCGEVPFEDDDPTRTMMRVVEEAPRRPSEVNRATPLALEALALRLLEKDPVRRTLTIAQIRSHVINYIEGIGRDYGRPSLWSRVTWSAGALGLFAFVVWYLTGRSIASLLALAPPAVLNATGWFLVVLALGYPLWAAFDAFRIGRVERDRFRAPDTDEIFVSGYHAFRTFAASLAPLFQLLFIVELVSLAVAQASRGAGSGAVIQEISGQMRSEWSQALLMILVFLFGYLFLLSTEVRYARHIDRYDLLVERRSWESLWPFFLIVVLLATIGTTDVLEWLLTTQHKTLDGFMAEQVLTRSLNLFDVTKTLVLQGTFLAGLVAVTTLLSFPFAEALAALRMAYQPSDEASVASRSQYFTRSMTVFRVARANCLYGGAVIGCLTAVTVLGQGAGMGLVEKVLYILGPSLIGFVGYWIIKRYSGGVVAQAPAVGAMLEEKSQLARAEQRRVNLEKLRDAPWRGRLVEAAVPVVCVLGYLLWTGSGIHEQTLKKLIMPVTTKGWLLILPYLVLLVVPLVRNVIRKRQRESRA
jgi:serine/threonine protein kinase